MKTHVLLAAFALSFVLRPAAFAAPPPNMIVILTDDQSYADLGWYYEHIYTPEPRRRPIPRSEGVRTDRWKYIRYCEPHPPLEQLSDLAADPQEETDLAHDPAHASMLRNLRDRCDAYRKSSQ